MWEKSLQSSKHVSRRVVPLTERKVRNGVCSMSEIQIDIFDIDQVSFSEMLNATDTA